MDAGRSDSGQRKRGVVKGHGRGVDAIQRVVILIGEVHESKNRCGREGEEKGKKGGGSRESKRVDQKGVLGHSCFPQIDPLRG